MGFTSLTVSFSWILANATVRIENESLGAGDQIELAVGAEVELIANLKKRSRKWCRSTISISAVRFNQCQLTSRIGVSEVAVGTRTVGRFLSRFCIRPLSHYFSTTFFDYFFLSLCTGWCWLGEPRENQPPILK